MFSLCIPTMNRFDSFLHIYLPKYIANPLISEIIITDETGDDAKKINDTFSDPKIKVHVNEQRLGAIFNKHKALRLATNEWIALIDSDNFADIDYFETAMQFIKLNNPSKESILSPVICSQGLNEDKWKTHRGFNFTRFAGCDITRKYLQSVDYNTVRYLSGAMNTGNYILNKYLVNTVSFNNEPKILFDNAINFSGDAIYFTMMLYKQFENLHNYYVDGMRYQHSIHSGSYYMTTSTIPSTRQLQQYAENEFIQLGRD